MGVGVYVEDDTQKHYGMNNNPRYRLLVGSSSLYSTQKVHIQCILQDKDDTIYVKKPQKL